MLDLTSAIQNRGLSTALNGNRMLTITVSVSFLTQLALVYLPVLQGIFQTTPLAGQDLALLFVIAAGSFGAHEVRRRYERSLGPEREEWEANVV